MAYTVRGVEGSVYMCSNQVEVIHRAGSEDNCHPWEDWPNGGGVGSVSSLSLFQMARLLVCWSGQFEEIHQIQKLFALLDYIHTGENGGNLSGY